MKKQNIDLMDGFDAKECVYDEKKEKRYHAGIWACLIFCAALILIRAVSYHVEEIIMVSRNSYLEAQYNEKSMQAYYIDESGRWRQYDISGFAPVHEGESIRLYYEENIEEAQPVNSLSFWLFVYALTGGISAFALWRILRIYRKKKHIRE